MHHRRAYGPQRKVTDQQKPLFIAESIARRAAEGRPWSFADYGIIDKHTMIEQVNAALQQRAA